MRVPIQREAGQLSRGGRAVRGPAASSRRARSRWLNSIAGDAAVFAMINMRRPLAEPSAFSGGHPAEDWRSCRHMSARAWPLRDGGVW